MSHQKQWVVTFCYKIHEKLKSHCEKSNLTDIDIFRTLSGESNRSSGEIVKKNKKKNKFVLTYMSYFVMRDFKIPHKHNILI